jgi:hypothetical protein
MLELHRRACSICGGPRISGTAEAFTCDCCISSNSYRELRDSIDKNRKHDLVIAAENLKRALEYYRLAKLLKPEHGVNKGKILNNLKIWKKWLAYYTVLVRDLLIWKNEPPRIPPAYFKLFH